MTRLPASRPSATPELSTDPWVVPESQTTEATGRGPRFSDDVWDLRPFAPRSNGYLRLDFTGLPDAVAKVTAKEFLYSRIHRAIPLSYGARPARRMKLTNAYKDFNILCHLLAELAALKRERKHTARDHAATVRELEETIRVYANQIQALALRNAELEDQARHLRHRLAGTDPDVIPLPDRS